MVPLHAVMGQFYSSEAPSVGEFGGGLRWLRPEPVKKHITAITRQENLMTKVGSQQVAQWLSPSSVAAARQNDDR